METRFPTVLKAAHSCVIILSFLLLSFNSSAQLQFKNAAKIPSAYADGAVGASYKFSNVTTGVDAIVTIDSIINNASLVTFDESGTGYEDAFQPMIKSGNNGYSYIIFSFRFVVQNSNTSIFLANLTCTNLDLDGNSNLKEMCEFDLGGGLATFESNTPEISVSKINDKYMGINVRGVTYNGIDTSAQAVIFKVKKSNIAEFKVKLGAFVSNNASANRQYSVYMKDFAMNNPFTLPLTLLNFDAMLKAEKVQLNWSTTNHKDFSHFILQKSNDGRNFKDVMTVMTDDTDFTTVHQYGYKDDVSKANESVIYYRLQMIDANLKYEYSPIRMVRLNAANTVKIQTFPNPVVSELRIMIPAAWQEKNVTYEIYSGNGALLNRVQKNNAVQIQQLNVSSLGSGNYIIRVTNGQEISTSKFIKH